MIIDPVTATLALLRSGAELTALTEPTAPVQKGVFIAGELPAGIADAQKTPVCVVIQLAPAPSSDLPILVAPFSVRFYGPSFKQSMDLYKATYALLYDTQGFPREQRTIAGRWVLRSADLSKPLQRTESEGWKVTLATLNTRWNLMEIHT